MIHMRVETCGCSHAVELPFNPLASYTPTVSCSWSLRARAFANQAEKYRASVKKSCRGAIVRSKAKSKVPKHLCQVVSQQTMIILLSLLLLSYGAGTIHCSTVTENSTDMVSMIDFKYAITNDPSGVLNSWNSSTPFCQWMGVNCSLTHPGRVVSLNLAGLSLTGTLIPSLGNLTLLRTLNLSDNYFSSHMPDLTYLSKLEVLDLRSNSLHGVIPDALANCSNLREILLHDNFLRGEIPLKIGLLSKLVLLSLGYNNLAGVIPPTLNNTQLRKISLPNNQLTGSIPHEFGHLCLSILYLGGNMLSGEFPTALLNMSSLQGLDLGGNRLHGMLPSNLGDALPNLINLVLFLNSFEGQIPVSLGNALGLKLIALSENKFTGVIPTFGRLTELYELNLEDNRLETPDSQSWEFLYALINCTNLNILSVAGNQLCGAIPKYIGELSTGLKYLLLDDNNLSGMVPSSIGNLTGLVSLALSNNSLIGAIGEWIGTQKQLQNLELNQNNFNGPIPSSIGNFTQLVKISLEQNNFTGTIPTSLAYLQQLSHLDLSSNNLHGNLPAEVFSLETLTTCVFSYNKIEGPMPLELSHLTQLTELRLSSNRIFGEIPSTLSECQSLIVIELDQNLLRGSIPMSLSNLKTLSMLNLSHNNLSGFIPTTLNGLNLLVHLDLSYNHLQGEVPINGVFANATAVSLKGNWGLCGGVEDLHMPTCAAVSRGIEWKLYLSILLTLVFGFMSCAMSIYIIFLVKKKSRRPYLILLSFGKKFPRVSYKDLAQATGNFSESNLIGRGSYGSVYRGKLTQAKIQVAIKVFDLGMRYAIKSFVLECEALRTIRHRNLLPILTSCSTIDNRGNDFKALIYEFMHNGNLDTWLHQQSSGVAPKVLGLAQRISIAVDIADSLAYLHHDCGRPIVHCDLKPTNILLDDDMNAHLGDFGIASLVVDSRLTAVGHSSSDSSIAVTGTIGYIAPEYAQTVHASTYGDVYSFGVLLLEMIIGKRPTDSMFEGGLTIIRFVESNFPDQVLHIIDAHLQEEFEGFTKAMAVVTKSEVHRCLLSLVQVAVACTLPLPRERMNMREVAINLHAIRKSYVAATE
ncbi:unnamed protein product [Urochloa humidicola]